MVRECSHKVTASRTTHFPAKLGLCRCGSRLRTGNGFVSDSCGRSQDVAPGVDGCCPPREASLGRRKYPDGDPCFFQQFADMVRADGRLWAVGGGGPRVLHGRRSAPEHLTGSAAILGKPSVGQVRVRVRVLCGLGARLRGRADASRVRRKPGFLSSFLQLEVRTDRGKQPRERRVRLKVRPRASGAGPRWLAWRVTRSSSCGIFLCGHGIDRMPKGPSGHSHEGPNCASRWSCRGFRRTERKQALMIFRSYGSVRGRPTRPAVIAESLWNWTF